jgi:hypothetical protein
MTKVIVYNDADYFLESFCASGCYICCHLSQPCVEQEAPVGLPSAAFLRALGRTS